MSVTKPKPPAEFKLPDGFEPRMISFDLYGTLINTPPANRAAFKAILEDAGRTDLDAYEFYSFWEKRNIAHYYEPYRSYKEINRLSLKEAYEKFGVTTGRDDAIQIYFDCFLKLEFYPDVVSALDVLSKSYKIALVSNIDDDLLEATPLGREFDLICTAQRARGYKADGSLFRYLLETSKLPVSQILHCGQSQFTDMVGGKPLGFTIAWINRRGLDLDPSVPPPDVILPGLQPLCGLLGRDGAASAKHASG